MDNVPVYGSVSVLNRTGRARLIFALSLTILAHALAVESIGAASVGWCRSDPVVVIDGALADVFVSIPLNTLQRVSGATEIVITTPPGVRSVLLASGVGFGYGEVVRFAESRSLRRTPQGIELEVAVYVPTSKHDDKVPVLVEFAPRVVGILAPTSAQGTANQWISLRALL